MESKKTNTEKEFSSNNAADVTEKLDKVDGGVNPRGHACSNCGTICARYQKTCHNCGAPL